MQPTIATTITVAILIAGCTLGPAISPRDCTPGVESICPCAAASAGVQRCDADGTLGACECPARDAAVTRDAVESDATPVAPDARSAARDSPDAPTVPGDTRDASDGRAEGAVDAPTSCREEERCDGACGVDYRSDPMHCGRCGRSCAPRTTRHVPACSEGQCVVRCIAGYVPCGPDVCVSAAGPGFDCARCGFGCLDGMRCSYDGRRGTCVPR